MPGPSSPCACATSGIEGTRFRCDDASCGDLSPDDAASRGPPGLERRHRHPGGGASAGARAAPDPGDDLRGGRGRPLGPDAWSASRPAAIPCCSTDATTRKARPPWPRSSRMPGSTGGAPARLRRDGGQGHRRDRGNPLPAVRSVTLVAASSPAPRRRRSLPGASAPVPEDSDGRRREQALRDPSARARRRPIIVAGSLYLVGEARAWLLAAERTGRTPVTTATAQFTREHFERLEEERLAVFASRARGRSGPSRSRPADGRGHARPSTRGIATGSFTPRVPPVEAQDAGLHPLRGRPLPHPPDAHDRGVADRPQRRAGARVERGPDRGDRARPRPQATRPFGHSGERVLDRLLRASHPQAGGFKHNYQSVRVVDRLEKRYDEPGLNLTHDVARGDLQAHDLEARPSHSRSIFPRGSRFESGGTLEAQVVNWSDEIAQQTHDLEDGLPLAQEDEIEAPGDLAGRPAGGGSRTRPRHAPRLAHPRDDRRADERPRRDLPRPDRGAGSRRTA